MKLQKNSKKYLIILYAIWELFTYYARLFKLDVPSDATKLPVKLSVDEDNVTHLIIEMPSSRIPDPYYTGDSMKTIFNEYLNIVLLPSQKSLVRLPVVILSMISLIAFMYIRRMF